MTSFTLKNTLWVGTVRVSSKNPYWATWVRNSWANKKTYQLVKRYMVRPHEELYHASMDPYELNNLVSNSKYLEIKNRLGPKLDEWMSSQGDPGLLQDTDEALSAARKGMHLFGPKQ